MSNIGRYSTFASLEHCFIEVTRSFGDFQSGLSSSTQDSASSHMQLTNVTKIIVEKSLPTPFKICDVCKIQAHQVPNLKLLLPFLNVSATLPTDSVASCHRDFTSVFQKPQVAFECEPSCKNYSTCFI